MLQIQRTPHLSCTSDEVFISLNHTPYTSNHSEFITGRITSPLNEINPSHSTDIVFIPWATTLDRFLYKSVEDVATSVNIMIRYGEHLPPHTPSYPSPSFSSSLSFALSFPPPSYFSSSSLSSTPSSSLPLSSFSSTSSSLPSLPLPLPTSTQFTTQQQLASPTYPSPLLCLQKRRRNDMGAYAHQKRNNRLQDMVHTCPGCQQDVNGGQKEWREHIKAHYGLSADDAISNITREEKCFFQESTN
ncbi:hypothetical protein C8Q75DRAFT_747470 [Abortiporus biennis]|nr:hypothetical protein C8Q75DRAFT_747470 [Abortiporus biennis]